MVTYQTRLRDHLLEYNREYSPDAPDDLSSSQVMCFTLFSPFILEDGSRVDSRLLKALGLASDRQYTGHFEKVLDNEEKMNFDFYLEAKDQKIFFEVKLSESEFGSCENDECHFQKLEQHYRPHLTNHVDARWLERDTFFKHYQILRNLSYLGRYPGSGLVFIFPKANTSLADSDEAIKKMVSKSLAPRVEILYLEYLVARILTLTEDDTTLYGHFMQFKEKYVVG